MEESDMYLYPNLNTFEIFPWRPQQGKVARLICDVYKPDGTPFESDPRYILKKVMEDAKRWDTNLMSDRSWNSSCSIQMTTDCRPRCHMKVPDILISGLWIFGENARRDMVLTLEDMGFEIESSHHEAAPAQHEIDFKYDEAFKTADNIMTFKLVVKTIAKRHGLHATFMPKPKFGINGSGMHLNMSIKGRNQCIPGCQ